MKFRGCCTIKDILVSVQGQTTREQGETAGIHGARMRCGEGHPSRHCTGNRTAGHNRPAGEPDPRFPAVWTVPLLRDFRRDCVLQSRVCLGHGCKSSWWKHPCGPTTLGPSRCRNRTDVSQTSGGTWVGWTQGTHNLSEHHAKFLGNQCLRTWPRGPRASGFRVGARCGICRGQQAPESRRLRGLRAQHHTTAFSLALRGGTMWPTCTKSVRNRMVRLLPGA